MMTNGVALPVYVTEILIYGWIEAERLATFHHTKLHAYTLSSLIKCNVGVGVTPGSVTPGLTMALLPQASLRLYYP